MLRALKRDLERVALMGVGEIRLVYYRASGPTHRVNYVKPSSDSRFNATPVELNVQIILMT